MHANADLLPASGCKLMTGVERSKHDVQGTQTRTGTPSPGTRSTSSAIPLPAPTRPAAALRHLSRAERYICASPAHDSTAAYCLYAAPIQPTNDNIQQI